MENTKIGMYVYELSNEHVTQNGIWAKCSFSGAVSKERNGQYNRKIVASNDPRLVADGVSTYGTTYHEDGTVTLPKGYEGVDG